jgi:hypothetical protein
VRQAYAAAFRRSGVPAAATQSKGKPMRSLLLLFLGVPIPIILLLAMCTHHF